MTLVGRVLLCTKEEESARLSVVEVDRTRVVVVVYVEPAEKEEADVVVIVKVGEEAVLIREGPAASEEAEDAEGEAVDETGTAPAFERRFCSLTEEAVLVTLADSIALVTEAAVVAGIVLEVDALGVGILRETPTAPQTWAAKARVTRGKRVLSVFERTCTLGCRFEVGWGRGGWERKRRGKGGLLPCWSATEQTVSIKLCSEVTNCELPQIQAKSEVAQPVAEMPASAADCWRWC